MSELLRVYRSFDGICAGASRLTVGDEGEWVVVGFTRSTWSEGGTPQKMKPAALEQLRSFLGTWQGVARDHANGWVDPRFGGCTGPILMGAVRVGATELHYRELRTSNDPAMMRRKELITTLLDQVGLLIPELSVYKTFA
jgi:hypothetical protein